MRNLVFAAVALLALGFTFATSSEAEARHCYYGGYGGYGYSGYPTWNTYYGGHSHWHDTSHLHYHPGGFERHGNHFHYRPGHWDVHRTGHWDHHPW